VIQRIFEVFYKRQIYLQGRAARQWLFSQVDCQVKEYEESTQVQYTVRHTRQQMLDDLRQGVSTTLDTIKREKLLGEQNFSEQDLSGNCGWLRLRSRADFVFEGGDSVTLIEGKGTRSPGKYDRKEQVLFASLCYLISRGKLPSRAGILYYRSGEVKWIDVSPAKIQVFMEGLLEFARRALEDDLAANPRKTWCRLCSFLGECSEGQGKMREGTYPRTFEGPEDLDITV